MGERDRRISGEYIFEPVNAARHSWWYGICISTYSFHRRSIQIFIVPTVTMATDWTSATYWKGVEMKRNSVQADYAPRLG